MVRTDLIVLENVIRRILREIYWIRMEIYQSHGRAGVSGDVNDLPKRTC